ncbi:LemA family protein [Mycoplasmopsis iners]|uniref:LemA family protein n=1 Tax=Mycoplasmopsis iners TaxID=76630 RepID=UPI00049620EA|nr:LemA family protein [Mycoplasmopsis iners]
MANLINPNNNTSDQEQGFNPVASNVERPATVSTSGKIIFFILSIIPGLFIPLIWYFVIWPNQFKRMQNEVNNAASTIDTQLSKRYQVMTTFVEATQSYYKHESTIFEEVARCRSLVGQMNASVGTGEGQLRSDLNNNLNGLMSRLIAVVENYPELKASQLTRDLMEQSAYLENEIAAARRLYNSYVNDFNIVITQWPKSVCAAKMRLTSLPLFQAANVERQRVSAKLN